MNRAVNQGGTTISSPLVVLQLKGLFYDLNLRNGGNHNDNPKIASIR
ncbi:hypothetical protein NBRC111893_2030 [Lentilactobacillus kosonis]|uniref:Uncharacterized protein n=1 Tax=Lentilactobacillus kosonis TaxID=2810561 RepID=A0A401FNE7_9LACO|nr:hypothetical protein NBRC111893_2030 [Lentilactobacillus kosonis]